MIGFTSLKRLLLATATMAVIQSRDRFEAELRVILEHFIDGRGRTGQLTRGLGGHVHRGFFHHRQFVARPQSMQETRL